jgi:hypothetical protein
MRHILLISALALSTARAEEPLGAGLPVSRPLAPVNETVFETPKLAPAVAPADLPDTADDEATPKITGPLQSHWSHYELLMTWSKTQPVPLLATRGGMPVVGGQSLTSDVKAGFRFGMGWAVTTDHRTGFEFEGRFLGTRVGRVNFTGGPIERPYIDSISGAPTAFIVNDGFGSGTLSISNTTRVQGWDVLFVHNLLDAGDFVLHGVGGYRYFGVNEGLNASLQTYRPGGFIAPITLWNVSDQFDARNNFHGGVLGLQLDCRRSDSRWSYSLKLNVALGTNFETVQARGESTVAIAALPNTIIVPLPAGMLAVGSNSARVLQSRFAVVPEARLAIGYRIGDNTHFICGYDFTYLSDAVRAGDQVDPVINALQSPILRNDAFPAVVGPNRPGVPFRRSDFWVQGITLGFDCRF